MAWRSHALFMAGESSSKSVRLVSGIEGVSDRTLSRILAVIKKKPELLSSGNSSRNLSRQAIAAARTVGTVKHILPLTKGPPMEWEVPAGCCWCICGVLFGLVFGCCSSFFCTLYVCCLFVRVVFCQLS